MAPQGAKRKRGERGSVDSGEGRPSPHRPGNTNLARDNDIRNDGNRRPSQPGGGGGRGGRRLGRGNDRRDSSSSMSVNSVPINPRNTQGIMSPPPQRPTSSGQAQTAAPSPAQVYNPPNTTPAPAPGPRPEPPPYDYTYITDSTVGKWAATGQQEVVAAGKQALDDLDALDLSTIFQELLRAALDHRLDGADAGLCVKEILNPDAILVDPTSDRIDGQRLFLDSLSIIADSEPFDHALIRLVSASGVSHMLLRQVLDANILQSLGLTRNTFIKTGIRQVTNLLYRQANHNLLREETEGYSKLVTELFTTSATSGSEPPASDIAEETFERVKGLIGTFDLDVGRVLDVTLDVFAAVLIKQFRFFVKFLRVSSWWPRDSGLHGLSTGYEGGGLPKWAIPGSAEWHTTEEEAALSAPLREERDRLFWARAREIGLDAFFELGGRQAVDSKTKQLLLGAKESDTEIDADRQWIEATGTMPPSGNRVAAQLLGFKLRFYSSAARDKEDILPANLIYMSALLIKIGFISLRDLYPHLWPLDENMEAVRDAKMKELAEKEKLNRPGGAAKNALMTAGALADDTLPNGGRTREVAAVKPDAPTTTNGTEAPSKEELPEPLDQKIQLLTNLLTIGAIPEALFILGRFPWIPEACPEIYDLIHRILNHSIQKVFEEGQIPPVTNKPLATKKPADHDQSSAPKGTVRRVDAPTRKPLRWPFPAKFDVNEGMIYRFYWDEWADNIPICQNVDDIFTLCSTFLNISGVNIGRDATLLSKLASIGTRSLTNDHSQANLDRWQDLLKRLLVPALSLTKSNTSIVNEIYDMLRYYPAPVRYNIYAEWFEGQTSRIPAMMVAFSRARLETLSTMKRISMTNLTAMARTLAKTAYASPGVVFKVALDQIEAYSNLTEVVVECAKYFTDLGYDVLIWSLMSSLGGKTRNRTRADAALLTSRWLIALSKFSGKVFKRYSIMNPAPILQYVNDQLFRGNATDLIILEELIAQMSGVVSDVDFTDSQLQAMTGGEVLRRQTLINLQDRRFDSVKTAKRFMRSLTETSLAGQLLISIAQHRQNAIYAVPEEDSHIKFLATLIDEAQRILHQYLDLLRSNLSVEQFDDLVPGTAELMADFGLDPSLAFLIGRASLSHRLSALQSPSGKMIGVVSPVTNGTTTFTDQEGDVSMNLLNGESKIGLDLANRSAGTPTVDETMTEASDIVKVEVSETEAASPTGVIDSWNEELAPLVAAVKKSRPETNWDILNPEFFVVFWQLSLADINMPMDSYKAENNRLSKEIQDIIRDRSDMSRPAITKRDEARKALEATNDSLLKEMKTEMGRYERSRSRLNKQKTTWFENAKGKYDTLNDLLLEECFLPRLLLSPSDTDYCFKLIKFLHNNGTPNFRTLGVYNRLLKANRLRSLIFSCTIREAENFGRFLKLIFSDLARWHGSKNLYEKEALGVNRDLPGFARKVADNGKPESVLEHEEFRRMNYNWHKNLNSALRTCLTGSEWMHIRNAITVLKGVIHHFPAVDFMGKAYQATLKQIGEREKSKREDLSLTANALLPELKKREGKWVMMQAFASNIGESSQQVNGKITGSNTPQSESKPTLNATAPEFKPSSRANSRDGSTPKPNEVEDGEVDDAKTSGKTLAISTASTVSTNIAAANESSRAATPSSIPARPDPLTSVSNNSRGNKGDLPSRPDVTIPGKSDLDRHRGGRRDNMPPRGDFPRDRHRDSSAPGRGIPESNARDSGRDRHGIDRDRFNTGRHGDIVRESRDRSSLDALRSTDSSGRLSREEPSRPTSAQPERAGPMVNPERARFLDTGRPDNVDPARAALISPPFEPLKAGPPGGRPDPTSREGRASRPHSPRGDRFRQPDRESHDDRRNDRLPPPRSLPSEGPDNLRRGYEDSQRAPVGPREDRFNSRTSDRQRDPSTFTPNQAAPRLVDPDHGRLSQPSRPQQDSSYGRLNPSPAPDMSIFNRSNVADVADVPSGPRDSRDRQPRNNDRGSRNSSAPQARSEPRRQEPPAPPAPEKGPPTGPSSSRQSRRGGSGQFENSLATNMPAPPPPIVASPSTPIHPDRMRHIPQAGAPPPPPPPPGPPPNNPTGVHPDRLRGFQGDQVSPRQNLPAVQTNNLRAAPSMPSPLNRPPSGPRNGQLNSNAASPNGVQTPTGPADNDRNSRPNRQFAGLNNMLQQGGQTAASDRNVSIKGRSNRTSVSGDLASSAPSTPVALASAPREPAREAVVVHPERADLFAGRAANSPEEPRPDSRASGRGRESRHGRDGRTSRRSSRERSPRREGGERRDRELAPAEDDRERGGSARGENRDRRGGGNSRESDRDRRPARDSIPGSVNETRPLREERRDDKGGRNGPPRNNESNWGGPVDVRDRRDGREGRDGPRGDNRRDTRDAARDDGGSGRKRRSEDAAGMEGRGGEKRARR